MSKKTVIIILALFFSKKLNQISVGTTSGFIVF